jgi:adenosine deaminase
LQSPENKFGFAANYQKFILVVNMESQFCAQLPKIELHAHLNGSLSVSTIGRLVRLHKENFPDEDLPPAAEIFQDPTSFDVGFAIFKCAQALVDHPAAVKMAAINVLEEFHKDHVYYVELRSTPRDCEGGKSSVEFQPK